TRRAPPTRRNTLPGPAPLCHFEPVQFLFHPMKGVVADLVAGTHGENGLPSRPEGSTMDLAVRGARGVVGAAIGSFICQMFRQLPPDGIRDRRSVALEAREPGPQRAFTRRAQLAAH